MKNYKMDIKEIQTKEKFNRTIDQQKQKDV